MFSYLRFLWDWSGAPWIYAEGLCVHDLAVSGATVTSLAISSDTVTGLTLSADTVTGLALEDC